jgi:hypothetical protein
LIDNGYDTFILTRSDQIDLKLPVKYANMFDQNEDTTDPYRGEASRWQGLTTYAFTGCSQNKSQPETHTKKDVISFGRKTTL